MRLWLLTLGFVLLVGCAQPNRTVNPDSGVNPQSNAATTTTSTTDISPQETQTPESVVTTTSVQSFEAENPGSEAISVAERITITILDPNGDVVHRTGEP